MDLKIFAAAAILLASTASVAHADMACLVEGRAMNEATKDCSQTNIAVPAADYAAQCKESGTIFAAMGGSGSATVMKACPPKAQAACVGPFGTPMTAYYYARPPQFLKDTKASCLAQKGKWVENP